MAFEIEKRFLLTSLPEFPPGARGPYEYTHGFLPGTTLKEMLGSQEPPAWEVTEINDDRSLILCEVELPDLLQSCGFYASRGDFWIPGSSIFPEWLRPHILRDVTEDESFEAFRLAR